jgi:purine-binding chemotaxis protein CheW
MKMTHAILVFRTDERFHALFLDAVEKVEFSVEVCALPDSPRIVLGVIDWRGTILPVMSMRRRLHLPEKPIAIDDRLIIARSSRRRLALLVEEIVRVTFLSEEDMSTVQSFRQGMESIAGAVNLDGDIVLIHDLDSFLDAPGEVALEEALGRAGGVPR